MLFINTRPHDRAQALTAYLSEAQLNVIELPLLELKACEWNSSLASLYQQLHLAQVIVVVSPMAVEVGMRYLIQQNVELKSLSHIQWVAVGKTTAKALSEYGIDSLVPEVETSEGMLSLDVFNHLQAGQKIAFWRGEGGRQFMMNQCQEQHIEIMNFILYERYLPEETYHKFKENLPLLDMSQKPIWTCISSEASWKNWLEITKNHYAMVENCHYLVLGDRLYELLLREKQQYKLEFNVTKVDQLNPKTILAQIEHLTRSL